MGRRGRGSRKRLRAWAPVSRTLARRVTWPEVARQLIACYHKWHHLTKEERKRSLRSVLVSCAGLLHKTVSSFQSKSQPRFKSHPSPRAALIIPPSQLSPFLNTNYTRLPPDFHAVLYFFHLVSMDIHVFSPMRGHIS